ncbi:MAG: hypothetical protein QM775_27220 [Pirellulales bacterium]
MANALISIVAAVCLALQPALVRPCLCCKLAGTFGASHTQAATVRECCHHLDDAAAHLRQHPAELCNACESGGAEGSSPLCERCGGSAAHATCTCESLQSLTVVRAADAPHDQYSTAAPCFTSLAPRSVDGLSHGRAVNHGGREIAVSGYERCIRLERLLI